MGISDPLSALPLDWTLKGVLPAWEGRAAAAAMQPPLSLLDDQLLLPVAILKREALLQNSRWMRAFLAATGVQIAPHGKTSMAPTLFRLQEQDGIWGMTAATLRQVRAYHEFGVRRVLLANQVVGTGAADWIVELLKSDPDFDF